MSASIKSLFQHYLVQLELLVLKIPEDKFPLALSDEMFSLEMNAKVAADFIMRGYCPLLGDEVDSYFDDESGKEVVVRQIAKTLKYLEGAEDVKELDDEKILRDMAGTSKVELCQSEFIYQYLFPNFLFHISMVYAIAKLNGVELTKGDFDGIHKYPRGFHFGEEP